MYRVIFVDYFRTWWPRSLGGLDSVLSRDRNQFSVAWSCHRRPVRPCFASRVCPLVPLPSCTCGEAGALMTVPISLFTASLMALTMWPPAQVSHIHCYVHTFVKTHTSCAPTTSLEYQDPNTSLAVLRCRSECRKTNALLHLYNITGSIKVLSDWVFGTDDKYAAELLWHHGFHSHCCDRIDNIFSSQMKC